jgi:hypothetical protein
MGWLAGKDAGIYVGWLGLDEDFTVFPGYGPSGVATFALDLEDGFKVTLSWRTDVISHADGTEQRISTLDRPVQHYDGAALLIGSTRRLARARLARYAAQGAEFLLALPHEALTPIADASGAQLTVSSLTYCDWKEVGQRVVVLSADRSQSVDGVIQAVSGNHVTLDVAPGSVGAEGGTLMPAMAVFLEPQQNFNRYRVAVDAWNLSARAAIFDFAPAAAGLDLGTINPAWAGARVVARQGGLAGNLITVDCDTFTSNPAGGAYAETVPTNVAIHMKGDTDTLGDMAALVNAQSSLVMIVGTYNGAASIGSGDAFTQDLAGGEDSGAMGTGATLTMYAGHPVWDRGVENSSTISEPVNAMTEILDLGGVPYAIGQAIAPVWGRAVAITGSAFGGDWAWLKLMLATLRGAQRMFWLPSWRDDLTWVSSGTLSLTVRTDDDSDLAAWYPSQRDRLQIRQDDGTITYVQITGTPVDNGDGTQTLTISSTLSGVDVDLISWLEPCRFEGDAFEVTFKPGSFEMEAMARAHAADEIAEVES